MLKAIQSDKLSCVKLLGLAILSISCSCATLRPPPKVTKCLINQPKGGMDCVNSSGTEFFLSFSNKDSDKHICMPGKQFIDATAWLQELIIMATKGNK